MRNGHRIHGSIDLPPLDWPKARLRHRSLFHLAHCVFKRRLTYSDTIGALPLCYRLITSLGRRRRRYVDPLLILHAHSNPFIFVVEVFVAIIDPSPHLLLHVAVSQVRLTEKAIGSKCSPSKPDVQRQIIKQISESYRDGSQKASRKH